MKWFVDMMDATSCFFIGNLMGFIPLLAFCVYGIAATDDDLRVQRTKSIYLVLTLLSLPFAIAWWIDNYA